MPAVPSRRVFQSRFLSNRVGLTRLVHRTRTCGVPCVDSDGPSYQVECKSGFLTKRVLRSRKAWFLIVSGVQLLMGLFSLPGKPRGPPLVSQKWLTTFFSFFSFFLGGTFGAVHEWEIAHDLFLENSSKKRHSVRI